MPVPSRLLLLTTSLFALLLGLYLSPYLFPNRTTIVPIPPTLKMGGGTHPPSPSSGYRSVAYFVNWAIYARKHLPQSLPVQNLTHILYAFANIRPESGEVYLTDSWSDSDIHWPPGDSWNDSGTNLYGCLKQLNLLKHRNRNLKLLLSVGGWTYSANFRAPAATAAGRARFAESAVALLQTYGFDGIDVDWEYPQSAQEAADYVALLREVRSALDRYAATLPGPAPHFELTVACPAGANNYEKLDLAGMDRYLDFWNLMAYDFAGSWDSVAGHQANLFPCPEHAGQCTPFNAAAAVEAYVAKGVPRDKIVMGMPLYGRAFENTDGPGSSYSGVGEGTWENGVHDYKKLPLEGSEVREEGRAGATYCYHPGRKLMVSYDTVPMARRKAEYIKEAGLGGGMWWESSADKEGSESLIGNVVDVFGGPDALKKQENCITYPHTKYDNLREGFPNK